MNQTKKGLRGEQENAISIAARKALDKGSTITALSLLESATIFLPTNLMTIMAALSFQSSDKGLMPRATTLFHRYLALCKNTNSLASCAIWSKNPSRERSIPASIKKAIDDRRRELEPNWDGVWQDPGTGKANISLVVLGKDPMEISDPALCLIAASQTRDWIPWIERYLELGGDPNNPKYLKTWASRGVILKGKPSKLLVRMLREFTMVGNVEEVRKFLRRITPIRDHVGVKSPNYRFARFALLFYCQCERLEHTIEDWVHIAKSAMYLNLPIIERIVEQILTGKTLPIATKKAFGQLIAQNGVIRVAHGKEENVSFGKNPLWNEVEKFAPINSDARKVLATYSRGEISRLEIE